MSGRGDGAEGPALTLIDTLDGTGVELDRPGGRLGVAGGKGFGGGFPHRCASEFGEPHLTGQWTPALSAG
jgi:hypothetical protein